MDSSDDSNLGSADSQKELGLRKGNLIQALSLHPPLKKGCCDNPKVGNVSSSMK